MRILQVAPYFPPYSGGQERYVYNLCKYLVRRGHEVLVLTSNYPPLKRGSLEGGRLTVKRLKVFLRPLRNPIIPSLVRFLIRHSRWADLVHVHNEHSFSSMVASVLKGHIGFPMVLSNHGRLIFGNRVADFLERCYSASIGKRVFRSADAITVNSPADEKYIYRLVPEVEGRVFVVPNAIDEERLRRILETQGEVKMEGGRESERFKLLFVGRLITRKGVEWLIKAMRIVRELRKEVMCLIVGEGEDEAYLRKLAASLRLGEHVRFLGRVSDKELVSLYLTSDAFVLPSISEGCPTVLLEAMYFGLPVVATNLPGMRDVFKGAAILVPPKDPHALAEAILLLLDDEELRSRLAVQGRKLVKERHLWGKTVRMFEEIYLRVLREVYA